VREIVAEYKALGIPASEVNITVVLHGGATYWALNDDAYGAVTNKDSANPNRVVIEELIADGVSIEVCGQALKHHKWAYTDILPGVKIVSGVCQRIVELQRQGYVYTRL